MIDIKNPLRTAYYQLLYNKLSVNGAFVPVSDSVEKIADTAEVYVIFTQQNGQSQNTHHSWNSIESITVDVITRGQRVAKSTVDRVAGQIYALLFPTPYGMNALPSQPGISIINARVTDDRYLVYTVTGGVNVNRRLITITQYVSQGDSGTPVAPGTLFSEVVGETPSGLVNGSNTVYLTAGNYANGSVE